MDDFRLVCSVWEGSQMEVQQPEEREVEEVRWEEFMPKMVIRVLLVEVDDSTRQIIGALLRKCDYRGKIDIKWLAESLIHPQMFEGTAEQILGVESADSDDTEADESHEEADESHEERGSGKC